MFCGITFPNNQAKFFPYLSKNALKLPITGAVSMKNLETVPFVFELLLQEM